MPVGANPHATAEPPGARSFNRPVCPRGHDKRVVGADAGRHCLECKRERQRSNGGRFVVPVCVLGHDKRVLGARPNGGCAECHRIRNRLWDERRRREARKANPDHPAHARHVPNLAAVRNNLGLSQAELALASGVSKDTIQKIEQGRQRARPVVLRKLLATVSRLMRERRYEEMGL